MTAPELRDLLVAFYTERLGLLVRHEASATLMGDYDINNTYQYVLNREETHVAWVRTAVLDLGGTPPAEPSRPTFPPKSKAADIADEDARINADFIDRWRRRVAGVTHARHKGMLNVVLGEMLEQQRFFEQAAQGRTDLLGTHMPHQERVGQVLSKRWVE